MELKTFDFFVVLLLIFIQSFREFCLVFFFGMKLRKEDAVLKLLEGEKRAFGILARTSRENTSSVGLLLAGRVPSSF